MNINGYNPYKKGFDMLVADIQEHEARCVTPSRCEPFSTKLSADGVNRLGDTIADLRLEVARLRVIEAAAVACSEHPVWNDDQFYGLMIELQRALRGEVGADKTVAQDKDAERYRQIRRGQHWSVIDGIGDTLRGDDLDVAIDATLMTPNV